MAHTDLGILVHGDNHFIVKGPRPEAAMAVSLARQWSVIQIGSPPQILGWTILNKAFREDLQWAVIVAGVHPHSPAVAQLLQELSARGIAIE